MVKLACANCRTVKYEKLETEKYDISDKTKKTLDVQAYALSRRVAEPIELPLPCDRCRMCYYCSEECKEVHYRAVHRLECEYFAKVRLLEENTPDVGLTDLDWDPPHERALLRHLIRIMVKRHEEKCIGSTEATCKVSSTGSTISASQIGGLPPSCPVNYHEDIYNLIFKSSVSEEHVRVATEAREILPLSIQPEDSCELEQVLSRIDCNKFGLYGDKGEIVGSSLHPSASFVNHSCLPNAFSHIVGDELTLYTLYPVEAGEELNISYIEPELALKERRAQLKETYGFDCVCRRCVKESLKDAPPKQLYDDFFDVHLNCPLCKHGLLMVPDDKDVRNGLEDTKNFSQVATPAEQKRIEALIAAASSSAFLPNDSSSQTVEHTLMFPNETQSFRSCNGCNKLQLRPNIPSIAAFKPIWIESHASSMTASKKQKRVKSPKNEPVADMTQNCAEQEDEELGIFFKVRPTVSAS